MTGKSSPYVEELAGMALNPKLDPTRQQGDSAQTFAVCELWGLGDQAKSTYPLFIKAFSSPENSIRRLAVNAFNSSGPATPEIVAGLISVLEREGDSEIRVSACGALATIGPPTANPAVPALIHVLEKDEEKSGWTAVMALGIIHSDACYAPIIQASASKHKQTRIDVVSYLAVFADKHAVEVRAILKRLAADSEPDVQTAARQALENLDGGGKALP